MGLPKVLFTLVLGLSTSILLIIIFNKWWSDKLSTSYNSASNDEGGINFSYSQTEGIIRSEKSRELDLEFVQETKEELFNFVIREVKQTSQPQVLSTEALKQRDLDMSHPNSTHLNPVTNFEILAITTLPLSKGQIDALFKGPKLEANDPIVVESLRKNFIHQPSAKAYNLKDKDRKDFSMGQIQAVKPYLNLMAPGFIIECGALDGETRSNTLYLEREFGWNGLLVEADPLNFNLLLEKDRKSYSANVCLSPSPNPSMLPYYQDFNLGHIQIPSSTEQSVKLGQALPCFPLYSILLALNRTVVDFFSLDIEGFELDILMTIPFDKIYIKVMTVEFYHVHQGADALDAYVKANGFTRVDMVTHPWALANDYIYVNDKELAKFQKSTNQILQDLTVHSNNLS